MPLTITATTDAPNARITLRVDGATTPTVKVERIGTDGTPVPVRNASAAEPIAGTWPGFDYEAGPGAPVRYRVTDEAAVTAESATVTLTLTRTWLKDPFQPGLSLPVTLYAQPKTSRARAQGVHRVLGRRDPIVVSGTLQSPEGDLAVLTRTRDEGDRLQALLQASSVLLVQIPGSRHGARYCAISDVTDEALSRLATDDDVVWVLSFVEVAAPIGDFVGDPTATYQTLKDNGGTYQTLRGSGTYLTLLQGT